MGSHEQSGVAGCFSVDEYERDIIRKHERTRKDKEDDRTRHIIELRAQTGPVFLTYPASGDVDAVVARAVSAPPLFDFTAPDGVQHTVWRVVDADRDALVAAFARIPFLYIADGHHRAASAMRARQALRERAPGGGAIEADTFLAVAFPDDQMQVLPYHRVVKDLAGHTPASFLEALAARVDVGPGTETPGGQGEVAMYLAGRWYTLRLAPAAAGDSAADRLDVSRLHAQVLGPLLGIGDPRTDTRIDFVGRHPWPARPRRARGRWRCRRRLRDAPGQRRGSDGDRRRRRDHAAEIDLVRAEAAGRPAQPPHLGSRLQEAAHMKVLVADQFEQSGLDGLAAAGCEVVFDASLKDDALVAALAESGRRCSSCGPPR